ncbi:DUF2975 domain-containing protein [Gramella sp. KN1008]|uniref:DUF2975 domain-containing protein n=1 Tax=Gramella sp. KN1008 TaxID=2529298 RepID=UPI00103B6A50|nr:DUF2975 domain-containing protein [Gramella sp. KN1008]TBW29869.1 DUF2975 domain-containing protein [Gramella sp. KN1008]
MKSSVLLRNIISLAYYSFIIVGVAVFGILIFTLIWDENMALEIFKNSDDFKITSVRALISLLTYSLISFGFWIYLFRLIRNLMDSLTSKSIFTKFQISSFKIIGQLLILVTVIDTLFSFIFEIIFTDQVHIKTGFMNFWLLIVLGLFFIFISQIFNKARLYKEENELTI